MFGGRQGPPSSGSPLGAGLRHPRWHPLPPALRHPSPVWSFQARHSGSGRVPGRGAKEPAMRGPQHSLYFAGTGGRRGRPAQSRPLPARCFWRPGGRSSSLGRRKEAQAGLFLCSGSRDSCTQGRRPPSRASQRRGWAPGGSLAARGFSALRGFSSFRGLSSFRDFSFRGLSFRGLSLGPPWARGARFSPAASPGSPSSFRAAAAGTSGLSSASAWGAGGTDGGAQATGFGCTRDSGG